MSETSGIGRTSVVTPAPGVHAVVLDGEKVLFSAGSQTLHHLDRTASLVWDCLLPPAPVAEISADLAAASDAPPEVVERDVLAVLEHLMSGGAVEVDVAEVTPDA